MDEMDTMRFEHCPGCVQRDAELDALRTQLAESERLVKELEETDFTLLAAVKESRDEYKRRAESAEARVAGRANQETTDEAS